MEDHRSSLLSLRGKTYEETAGVIKAPPTGLFHLNKSRSLSMGPILMIN